MNRNRFHRGRHACRGSVTIVVLVMAVVLVMFIGAMLTRALQGKAERSSAVSRHRADFVADAGVSHAVTNLTSGETGDIGAPGAPLVFGGGDYFATVDDNGDDTFFVTSTGSVGAEASRVEALLVPVGGGIYDNALFAGNTSGDPLYELELGGEGTQADLIEGDIYSGGDVTLTGGATVTGTVRADGTISGTTGEEGASQSVPDLGAENYESTADFDITSMFAAGGSYLSNSAGGSAYQLPEDSPGHIFRLNPSDRTANTSSTEKDDYFLEDPYEEVRADPSQDGSDPYTFTLSGVSGEAGPDSNGKVFFIDGNLWLHNKRSYSLGLSHDDPNGVQVTFVVKGNIYFADNLFYGDPSNDGMAFIAMKDESVTDSGNIYFGDPVFGTLQQMHAFMYAENNFYDLNLDEDGSSQVEVYGNMTAGNQVVVERDYGTEHTKLYVDFDERISSGELEMPGLPGTPGGAQRYRVDYWHRSAAL